ncbi:MAG: penicillin-binding protein activator LpoB [Desulfuromonadaceae bacterium]
MKHLVTMLLFAVTLSLAGCVTLHQSGTAVSFQESWGLVPFVNNTETPYAAERCESIVAALLHARGVQHLERIAAESKPEELGMDRGEKRQREALELAKQKKVRYVLTGSVNEWRYKVGLDGEPVAAFALQLIELPEGRIVWSGAAGKSGWSRDAVSSVAQQVLDRMLAEIRVLPENQSKNPQK